MATLSNIRGGGTGAGGPPRTPSQEIIDDGNRVVLVTDSLGRQLGVRRVNGSLKRRVYKVLTPESQAKDQYLGMVMLSASCVSIDGEEVRFPTTELQFDALIDRLEDEGFAAISNAYRDNFGAKTDPEEDAKN